MIFKTLFRPKYQDPSAKVRIKAIENLDPQNSEQKSILHELAFNDGDINVNLAALEKLDSFALWCKTYQTANQERIRKQAQKRVEEVLFNESADKISSRERLTFIKECRHIPLLEKLVKLDWLQSQHADLLPILLDRIAKQHVEQSVFSQTQSQTLQSLLVQRLQHPNELQKALKKALSSEIEKQIEDKLEQIQRALEKPKAILKEVTLVLSKLNALRDSSDFEQLATQLEALQQEFSELAAQFSCLDPVQQHSLQDKYESIVTRLEQQKQILYPAWQARAQKQQVARQWQSLKQECASTVEQLCLKLADQLESIEAEHLSTFTSQVQKLQAQFDEFLTLEPQPPKAEIAQVKQQLTDVKASLEQLPQMQEAVNKATQLLSDFQQQAKLAESPVQNAKQSLAELERQYLALRGSFGELWPASLHLEFTRLKTEGRRTLTAIQSELKQQCKRLESKLNTTQRFIDAGKFNLAIKVFDEAKRAFEDVSDASSAVLERRFERVKEQVVNLRQWQEYIAAPRKPKLLQEAQSLANEPLDIDSQAKAVKNLRKQWQSFGNLSTEEDNRLNAEFDKVIELAFEPCRRHYEQLEQQRQDNLSAKRAIIGRIEALQGDPRPLQDKISEFVALKNQFKAVGQVDHSQYKSIQKQFFDATAPMNQGIKALYQDNATLKMELIEKAQSLIALDDVELAVEQAKGLQQRWKQIGSVGKKQEQKLWNEFRDANDKIFSQRKAQQDQAEQANQIRWQEFEQQLMTLTNKINQQQDLAELQALNADFDALDLVILDYEKQWNNKAKGRISTLRDDYQQKLTRLSQAKDQQQWLNLFELLSKRQKGDSIPASELSTLPKVWQQWFSGSSGTGKTVRELVVTLEILKEVPSPKSDETLRQQIQLQLMSQKLQHGEQPDELALLADFVEAGMLDKGDASLLERMKALWIKDAKAN